MPIFGLWHCEKGWCHFSNVYCGVKTIHFNAYVWFDFAKDWSNKYNYRKIVVKLELNLWVELFSAHITCHKTNVYFRNSFVSEIEWIMRCDAESAYFSYYAPLLLRKWRSLLNHLYLTIIHNTLGSRRWWTRNIFLIHSCRKNFLINDYIRVLFCEMYNLLLNIPQWLYISISL